MLNYDTEKQSKDAVLQNEEKARLVIENAYDAFASIDKSGRITDWNPQAEKTFGWSFAEAVGQDLFGLVAPVKYIEKHQRGMKDFFVTGKSERVNRRTELMVRHRDGHEFPVEMVIFPLSVGDHQLICGFAHDITERKLAEETERQVLRMKEREEFLFTLTHDLKNPLLGANRILEMLTKGSFGTLSDEAINILFKLEDSNKSLIKLIHNLIEVYRYEIDIRKLALIEIDMCQQISHCVNYYTSIASSRNVVIKTNLPSQQIYVLGEASSLYRVIQNLLDNAIKFSPDGGTVEISLRANGKSAVLNVHNYGVSIPAKESEGIFKRFWQGSEGKRYVAGSGLGLYLCNQIVTALKGTITFTSDTSKGTTFMVRLPVYKTLSPT